jgi:predicted glycosyl hydrolase (DUF1957 family)
MIWINFLHIYQLPNSDAYIIEEATEKSYKRIVAALETNPNAKFTMNITGCLVDRWQELRYFDLIERIKKLVERGQIELVGSVAYHCLMPLIPKQEVARQIKENGRLLRAAFGDEIKLRGFFMPEMAYSAEAARIAKNSGFEWLILDEICYNGRFSQVDFNKVYKDKGSGMKVVFRSRDFSNCYVPEVLNKKFQYKDLAITATDGELYGLRHRDRSRELEKTLKNDRISTMTVSEFIDSKKELAEAKLIRGNWESTEKEILDDEPYALWLKSDNDIHRKLWKFADLAIGIVEKYRRDPNRKWAHYHLSRGLASCTFWWASAKDFSYIFGPHAWNPDVIERGINQMIRAVRSIEDDKSRDEKVQAEELCLDIKSRIWQKHWELYWKKKPEEN